MYWKFVFVVFISFEANFEKHPQSEPPSQKIKLVRYQENPEKNWGPKARAKGARGVKRAGSEEWRKINQ
jgi:tRNA (guanine26-N2/guanine27-N2)-dimethyltransferase